MEQYQELLQNLSREIAAINKRLEEYEISKLLDNWIPRKKLSGFFEYEDTQMAALINSGKLIVTQIGKRKFIKKSSVLKLLEENIINKQVPVDSRKNS